jgi:hypothetical protein
MREARNAIPPTQIADVYGTAELYYIAKTFNDSYTGPNVRWNEDPNNKHVMYLDVQGFLQDEVQAAYELLSRKENKDIWQNPGFSLEQIAWAIRVGHFHQVCQMRENFYSYIQHTQAHMLIDRPPRVDASGDDCDEQVVKALAWAILVESALLNGHLIEDMKKVAVTKGAPCSPPDGTAFYLPEPDETAIMLFNEYVAARWPIHVFALDPYTQEQNIANDFQRRRELQIALSLGFAQGQISANDMMNYARKVETEIQTVQLNKTIVAFSHGDDTFGWRFYPPCSRPRSRETCKRSPTRSSAPVRSAICWNRNSSRACANARRWSSCRRSCLISRWKRAPTGSASTLTAAGFPRATSAKPAWSTR